MKRIILVTLVMLTSIGAFAQIDKNELAVIRKYFRKDKSDLVKENIKMSEAQSRRFWPVYKAYEKKRISLANQRFGIINDYMKQFDTMTGHEATVLVTRTLDNDQAMTALQRSFFQQFADVIGGKNAAQFYQLEAYIEEVARMQIQDNIPFLGELKNGQ